jgi:eukaryotic-like serine/threonine-protein kinase
MLAPLQPDEPRSIGPYRLIGQLGRGGMGQVFLGRSAGGRPRAVKVIRAELAADPEFRTRFRREVDAARKVSGMFTALVVDADLDGAVPWLATAYVAGPSLAEAVRSHGPLPVTTVLALAAGLAESLDAIHAAGVVHRDLKPSNVLLAEDGPRVIDFGISEAAEASALPGTDFGSPGFMSPEQALGHDIGPASDIFSLGAVLTYAATGHGPYGSGSSAALVYRLVNEPPQLDDLPGELRWLAGSCLARRPNERPTADRLLAEVGAIQPESGWLPEPVVTMFAQDQVASAKAVQDPPVTAKAVQEPTTVGLATGELAGAESPGTASDGRLPALTGAAVVGVAAASEAGASAAGDSAAGDSAAGAAAGAAAAAAEAAVAGPAAEEASGAGSSSGVLVAGAAVAGSAVAGSAAEGATGTQPSFEAGPSIGAGPPPDKRQSGRGRRQPRHRLPRSAPVWLTGALLSASAAAIFALTGAVTPSPATQAQPEVGGTVTTPGSTPQAPATQDPPASAHPRSVSPSILQGPSAAAFLTPPASASVLPSLPASQSAAPHRSPSASPSASASSSASPSASASPSGSASPSPSSSSSSSSSPSPSPSPSPSTSPSPSPSTSPSPSPSTSPSSSPSTTPSTSSASSSPSASPSTSTGSG